MSSEWGTYRLEEICEFINGFAFKSTDYVAQSAETIEVLRMGYIARGGGFKEDNSPVYVPRVYGKNLDKYLLKSGDLVIAMTDMKDKMAILGNTARIRHDNRFVLNQRVGCIRVKKHDVVDSEFLYYYSNSLPHIDYLRSRANSGVQVNLSTSAIKESYLELPSLKDQKYMAEILSSLDDRIILLRETNATLEAIAQALFKSWFVDFDPVRAKMEGRTPEGMDEATAALFPDSFEPSELGKTPSGWRNESLDEIATYLNGLALQKFPPTGINDLPVIKIAQLRKGDTTSADRAARSIKPEYIIKDGDVLFSWSGSLEVEIWCGGEGALNQHLFKVTSAHYPKWFYFLWTRYHLAHFREVAASKATTMGHIQRAHLSQAKVVVPTPKIFEAVESLFRPLISQLIDNSLQVKTLAELRDTLLPRLISGQLLLPEAEKQVIEALA
jgi:type I restriction enzyme S subunit